jgi:RNA polymerase sigma factor for flagellar operon FliA
MVAGRTVGRLWTQYLKVREELRSGEGASDDEARREAERQEGQLRDRLVVNYSPLVKYVASRVGARVPGAVEQEDMISWGVLGLLSAIETYDPNREGKRAKFESYAISKIRWAILDQLRSQDWVPRRVRMRAQQAEAARTKLTQELKRRPSEGEIAEELGIGIGEYHGFLDQYSRAQITSLDARLDGSDKQGIEYGALVADIAAVDPQSHTDLMDLRSQLVDAVSRLEDRERLVATFYFYEGLTLKEVGKALELSEGRISQILRDALTKLRKHLEGSLLEHDDVGGWRTLN